MKAFTLEAMLSNHGETARKGRYVEFLLGDGPDDPPHHPFRGLKCGAEKGQRFRMTFEPIADDDTVTDIKPETEKPKRAFHTLSRAQQAGILCGSLPFQKWTQALGPDDAAKAVRTACQVDSRAKFDTDGNAAQRWDNLLAEYERDTGRIAEERQ